MNLVRALTAIAENCSADNTIPPSSLCDLKDALQGWKHEVSPNENGRKYVHLLDGEYDAGKSSIDFGAFGLSGRNPDIDRCLEKGSLKGKDVVVVRALEDACGDGADFAVFLASFERGRAMCRRLDPVVCEDAVRLVRVFGLDGSRLAEHVLSSPDEVAGYDTLRDDEPDKTECENPSERDSNTEHWWQRTAVVVVLAEDEGKFLLSQYKEHASSLLWSAGGRFAPTNSERMVELLKALEERYTTAPSSNHVAHTLRVVSQEALAQARQDKEMHETYRTTTDLLEESPLPATIISSSIMLNDVPLFQDAAAVISGKLPIGVPTRVGEWLGEGKVTMSQIRSGQMIISQWIATITELQAGYATGDGGSKKDDGEFSAFIEQKVQEILDRAPKLYVEDGPALVSILSPKRLDTPESDNNASIISTCERFADKTPALISFLVALRNSDTACPEGTRKEAFAAVLRTTLSNFDLAHDPKDVRLKAHERPRQPRGRRRAATPPPRTPCLDGDALVRLAAHLLADDDDDAEGLSALARSLGAQTSRVDVRDFDAVLLPFLRSLAGTADPSVLTALHHNDDDDPLRTLYATTLSAYRSRHLGPPPEFDGWVARLEEAGVDWRVVLGEEVYERVVEGKKPKEGEVAEGSVNKRKAPGGSARNVRRRVGQTDVVDLMDDEPWRR
ncbi:hypothetical protein SLS58_004283 [Diplodia intermedia]|uniref:Uncharacterized protein n=1 Tax=Diplodia intermedia TaxID=856260 RepID=A0ABR3TTQ1_9PEZI